MRNAIRIAAAGMLLLMSGGAVGAATITIAPTTTAPGYVPLNVFAGTTVLPIVDDTVSTVNTPAFTYAGESWDRVTVTTDGIAIVSRTTDPGPTLTSTFAPQPLPDGTPMNNILAPFWTDLVAADGGQIRVNTLTDGVSSWLVIDWASVYPFLGSGSGSTEPRYSFELWIGLGGTEDVTFAYDTLAGNGGGGLLSVGAEDATGTVGATYYHNGVGTLPTNGSTLRVTTSGFPVPEPATLAMVAAVPLLVTRRRRQVAFASSKPT